MESWFDKAAISPTNQKKKKDNNNNNNMMMMTSPFCFELRLIG
jgi:hypothetical protein